MDTKFRSCDSFTFFNDTLKVKNDHGTNEYFPKILLICSVRKLHSEMLNGIKGLRDEEGKARIGDSTLRKIIPDNLRPFTTRYKQSGCELCIVNSSLQESLNAWRKSYYYKLLDMEERHRAYD